MHLAYTEAPGEACSCHWTPTLCGPGHQRPRQTQSRAAGPGPATTAYLPTWRMEIHCAHPISPLLAIARARAAVHPAVGQDRASVEAAARIMVTAKRPPCIAHPGGARRSGCRAQQHSLGRYPAAARTLCLCLPSASSGFPASSDSSSFQPGLRLPLIVVTEVGPVLFAHDYCTRYRVFLSPAGSGHDCHFAFARL